MKVLVTIADSDYEMLREVLDAAAVNMDIEQPYYVEILKDESTKDSDDTQVSRVSQDSSESVSQQSISTLSNIIAFDDGMSDQAREDLIAIRDQSLKLSRTIDEVLTPLQVESIDELHKNAFQYEKLEKCGVCGADIEACEPSTCR